MQQAADYCQRSAEAWRCNGYPERAYAAERLAKDFAESAAALRTAALHSDHIGRNGEEYHPDLLTVVDLLHTVISGGPPEEILVERSSFLRPNERIQAHSRSR